MGFLMEKELKYLHEELDKPAPTLDSGESIPCAIASEEETRTGRLLVESQFISDELSRARRQWLDMMGEVAKGSPENRDAQIRKSREAHFQDFPVLREFQTLIDLGSRAAQRPASASAKNHSSVALNSAGSSRLST